MDLRHTGVYSPRSGTVAFVGPSHTKSSPPTWVRPILILRSNSSEIVIRKRGSGSCQRNRQERARRLLRSSCFPQASPYGAVLRVRRIAFPHQILLPRLASAGTTGWITQLSKNAGTRASPVRRLQSVPRHPRIRRPPPQGQTARLRLLRRP
jgi:hypothetical protein